MGVDMIVRSKRVFTSEPGVRAPRELAFAIRGGRIVLVGAPDEVIAASPAFTPVADLGDRFVCPGFHDAHVHFYHTAMYAGPYVLDYIGKSEAELVGRAREFAATLPPEAWVVTRGWREYRWDPPVLPSKRSIDEAFPDRPCVMLSGDGHTMWANTRAMEAMGVTRDSVPPEGGSYDRDENGELTGIIREAADFELQPHVLSWLSPELERQAYVDEMALLARQGITSICDMSIMPLPGCDFIRDDIYESLAEQGRMTVRAHLFPTLLDDHDRLERLQARYGGGRAETEARAALVASGADVAPEPFDGLLRAPGYKQFFDGVSSQHTAYLTEPYSNPRFPGDRGQLTIPAERMRALVLGAAERGHAVRIHTIGDGAIHAALDIFAEARERHGAPTQGRNALEHLENLLPGDLDRLREVGVLASSQPCHITLDPGGPERDLGPVRSKLMWPFASYLAHDVDQAFGTDSPITPITSMDVLYTAVTRQDPQTHAPAGGWLPSERISMADALRIYTAGSAAAAGREAELGRIAPGCYADFVVLDQDLLGVVPEEIQGTKVLATYVGGRQVL